MPCLDIHPDIRRAQTPTAAFYREPGWYEACQELVFARSWLSTGLPRKACSDAQVWPFTLGPGCLDEPLLFHIAEGTPQAISNTCSHRGALLLEEPHAQGVIRCPYHGRRFSVDGKILDAPCFHDAADFPTDQDDLPRASARCWQGLSFASLDPAARLDEALDRLEERVGWLCADLAPEPQVSFDYDLDVNWALYVDNYSEGLHIPYVHPGLASAIDLSTYHTELFDQGSLQIGSCASEAEAFALPPGHTDVGRRIGAYYFFLFPGTMLNFYPWGLSINLVQPLAPQQTRVVYQTYLRAGHTAPGGLGGALDEVEREDQAVIRRCQQGLAGRLYRRGRYAPGHEQGTHHFHRMLDAALSRG